MSDSTTLKARRSEARLRYEIKRLRADLERLRGELEKVSRQPVMPLPDPVAHSWEAFGRRAYNALMDCRRIAKEAIAAKVEE